MPFTVQYNDTPVVSNNFNEDEVMSLPQYLEHIEATQSHQSLCSVDVHASENFCEVVSCILETVSPEADGFSHQMPLVSSHNLSTPVNYYNVPISSSLVVCIPEYNGGEHPSNSEV